MTQQKELGDRGEALAAQFLHALGLDILATNWRHRRGEVDIVARSAEELIIVEVKARSTDYFGQPEESVDARKQELLAMCAWAYLEEHDLDLPVRFDIISILFDDKLKPSLHHIPDAFFPVDEGPDENF